MFCCPLKQPRPANNKGKTLRSVERLWLEGQVILPSAIHKLLIFFNVIMRCKFFFVIWYLSCRAKYTKTKCAKEFSKAESCIRDSDEKGGFKYAIESITGKE